MIKKSHIPPLLISLVLLLAGLSIPPPGTAVQSADSAREFPAQLLDGLAEFDIAVQIHGDIRGNFGPCG